VEGAEQLGLFV